jgi:hypothetical protein
MKKIIIITVLIIAANCNNNLSAQSFGFGTIAGDVGVGFGMYGIQSHSPVNGKDITGLAFVGSLPSVNVEFGLLRLVGVGVHYRRGTYGPYNGGKIRGNDIAGMVNLHLANKKDKFDLIIGGGYGLSSMKTNSGTLESLSAKGGLIRVHVTPHLYFGKYVGMFLRLAYNKHLLSNNIEMIDANGKLYTEAEGATWNMGGIEFNFGVAFKLALLGSKEESK